MHHQGRDHGSHKMDLRVKVHEGVVTNQGTQKKELEEKKSGSTVWNVSMESWCAPSTCRRGLPRTG